MTTALPSTDCPALTREQRVALALAEVARMVRDVKLIEGGDPHDPTAPGVELRLRRAARKSIDEVNAALTHASLRFGGCTPTDFGYRWLPASVAEARLLPVRVVPRGGDAGVWWLERMAANPPLTPYALVCLFRAGKPPTFYANDDAAASRYALKTDAWGSNDYPIGLVRLAPA